MIKKLLFVVFVSVLFTLPGLAQGGTGSAIPAASSKPTKSPVFRPTKDQIKQVQTILNEKKLYSKEPSGKYDDETRAGIKSFQKDNGLKETGTLNRATLEKFEVELTESQKKIPVSPGSFASDEPAVKSKTAAKTTKSAPATSIGDKPKRPAPFRANADQIKEAQRILKDGKMYSGEETGKFDDAFRDGLGKYQEANDLKVTKTLNAITLEKMGIELTDAQKANVAAQAAYDAAKDN